MRHTSNPAGVSTIIEATQTLAGVYSRTIQATGVQQDVAQRLKRASVPVSGGLSATPLPNTPLIKVTARRHPRPARRRSPTPGQRRSWTTSTTRSARRTLRGP